MSLEATNELLALIAYEGIDSQKASEYDVAQKIINWPPKDLPSPSRRRKQTEMGEKLGKQAREMEEEMMMAMDSLDESAEKGEHL